MRTFACNDLDGLYTVTEEWMRDVYHPYVLGRLAELGRDPITLDESIENWLICNWGWEVK